MDLDRIRGRLQPLIARRDASLLLHERVSREHADLERLLRHTKVAQQVFQTVAATLQSRVQGVVSAIVTRCLFTVFGENAYTFETRFVEKYGKSLAEFVLIRDGVEFDPLDGVGGGITDVVAFGLRLSVLVLSRNRRRLLILDEPFRFVSARFRPALCEMLEALADEFGLQLLQVTHIPELAIGKVVELPGYWDRPRVASELTLEESDALVAAGKAVWRLKTPEEMEADPDFAITPKRKKTK